MSITTEGLNVMADGLATAATYLGLVDETGTELSGGSPGYARKAVTWTSASNGKIEPNADTEFDIPSGTTVGGWRAYSASTGGTDYGGEDLTNESFAGQGTYTLEATGTYFDADAAA